MQPAVQLTLSDVGVVVVTYEARRYVQRCLAALPLHRLGGVIVVDNASQDGTAELVEAMALPGVLVRRLPTNVGFGAACNRGAADLPSVRRFLFLNPDAEVDRFNVAVLKTYLLEHPTAAIAAPRLTDLNGNPLSPGGREASLRTELYDVLPRRLRRLAADRQLSPDGWVEGPVGYVEGACMLIDSDAFRTVGGFDERYFLYYEELDLARRLEKIGRTVDLVPAAIAKHRPGSSTREQPFRAKDSYFESAVLYLRTWSGSGVAALFCLTAIVSWEYERAARALRRADLAARRRALRSGWQKASDFSGGRPQRAL